MTTARKGPSPDEPRVVSRPFSAMAPRDLEWLWPRRIPLGAITLVVGRPGSGKSFATCDAAARVSTGRPWPDGSPCRAGDVLLCSVEDDPERVIHPRLTRAGADLGRIVYIEGVRRPRSQVIDLLLLSDTLAFRDALDARPDTRLLVIDPVGSFLGGKVDTNRDNEVRSALGPLARLATERSLAVLVVMHNRKAAAAVADDAALGSRGFVGLARSVLHLGPHPKDPATKVLAPGKINLCQQAPSLGFRLIGPPDGVAALEWLAEPVAVSADDLYAEPARPRGRPSRAKDDAAGWLAKALAAGPRLAADLLAEWTDGHHGSKRTISRAKQDMGIEAYRESVPGPWLWRLPKDASQGCQKSETVNSGTLGILAENAGFSGCFEAESAKDARMHVLGDLGPADETNRHLAELADCD